jgi:hypothetical protein
MNRNVLSRSMIVGGVLAMGVPVFAQGSGGQTATPPVAQSQPTPTSATNAQLDRLRADVGTFEIVLQRAVDKAALELTQWAETILPNVPLFQAAPPIARGVPAGDVSITFHIEVSEMVGVNLWQTVAARTRPQGDPNVRTTGATVIQGDPLTGPPAASPATGNSINAHYSDFVRDAVIDAILDQSGVLPLKDEQTLAVAVIPVSVTGPPAQSRTLILSIKGLDLSLLRQGKISRDEAKRRIIETRF